MAQMINTNISSLNAQNNLTKSQNTLTTALQRISTGLRINSAKDDAAGSAISSRMASQISGNQQASRNANDGISLMQTAEGALGSITESLQRIRELTVQSANGTNKDIDRTAMQAEVTQLLSEIQRVSTATTFNGKALLDGTLSSQQFQIGANAGETISLSISSAQTAKLGSSDAAAITTAQNASQNALKEGAFTLNGVMIGPSLAAADAASTAKNEASSIAKAAAVNLKTEKSGVSATINATEVAGTTMSAGATSGTIKLNGISIALVTTGDAASSRAAVVSSINAFAKQTGVTAIDTNSDISGVKLVAADGRNIQLTADANLSAAKSGLADATTAVNGSVYTGSITLNSDKAIDLTSNLHGTGGIEDAGLAVGNYKSQTAYASTAQSATPTTVTKADQILAGDFTINGLQVGSSQAASDTASFSFDIDNVTAGTQDSRATSGIAKAAAINAMTGQTGVTATVNATTVQGSTTAMTAVATNGATTGTLYINDVKVDISLANSSTTTQSRKAVVDAINAKSGQTGVIATDTNDDSKGVILTAADGRNITAINHTGSGLTAANTGLGITMTAADATAATQQAAHTSTSTLTLSSTKSFTIGAGSNSAGTTALHLSAGTYGAGRSGQALSTVNISTVEGANAALTAIDNALGSVNASRSEMGAVQNRFSQLVSNLAITTENLTASKSRIMDADFASETATLTKSQIMQQAGTAMLAQANSLPQGVLSLLK